MPRWAVAAGQYGRCAASRRGISDRAGTVHHRSIRARRKSGRGVRWRSTGFSRGWRAGGRLLSLLRQNPELMPFIALDPRCRAAACRILAQNPAADRSAGRSEFFGSLPDEAALEAGLAARLRDAQLRGRARRDPAVRPGAHVPDRRAYPVRFGFGRAGRRTIRAACRCADPRRA